ncbi:uncharacterized protein LOC18425285 [Amborella trichopoda]|nr:uncharacterized protein LOC18425285 [Amborella trichopoda]|eukprot:XP_006829912.3 uncharacterized protein LOC18425285 [Amborella trichopoda]
MAAFNSPSSSLSCFMGKFYGWQMFLMVGAIVIGALLRKRQWEIITSESLRAGGSDLNLVKRIEKLEEDVRSCGTFIRMLSRQLEKLGIRFRVTRKALKDPISETAALAQKNSEATRALAMQEDILEKELGEIQKVLLAMQEQQQKQLELILAIGKARRLQESQQDFVVKESGGDKSNSAPSEKTVIEQMETPV